MIILKEIDESNFYECLNLNVNENQNTFVAKNIFSLAQAWLYYNIAKPFAIYYDNIMVGFLMFSCDEIKNECWIWRFMIDERYQNLGYGKEAMKIALEYITKNTNFKSIKISFKPENKIAEKLYMSCGFEHTGEIDDGEVVMILNL